MKLATIALLATLTIAQSSSAAEQKINTALVGTWAVDTARLPIPEEARPKSVTITFSNEGSNRLRTRVEVVDPAGARLEEVGITPLDGSPTPIKSNFEADVSATTIPRPDVLIMQLAKNGTPLQRGFMRLALTGRQ